MAKKYGRAGRYAAALVLLAASLVLGSRDTVINRTRAGREKVPAPAARARVTRVIDGDTVVIDNGCRVRYIGVDTPETRHPKKGVEYFGKEASDFNRRLVAGKKIRLEYDAEKFDKYGRLLAYVYADGVFVNAELVVAGYARARPVPPNTKHADLFLDLQSKAKAGKKGLWSRIE